MDAATSEGYPAWWTSYIDPEEDNYEPCDARVLLCHKIMSHAPSWIASVGSFTFWGSDHALVPVNMAAFMAAFPHQDELHELLQETPEQVLSCLSACVHQLREDALQGRKIELRPFNVPGALSLSSVAEPSQLDKLVALRGRVWGLTRTIPAAESIDYDCVKCKTRQRITALASGGLQKPSTCKSRTCRHRSLVPVPGTAEPFLWRCAWVMMEKDDKNSSSDFPAIVPVYATLEMTESLAVGQAAEIYGIVKIAEMQCAEGEPESERVKLDTYIYAMSISKVCELKTAAIATMPNIHINAYDGDQGISMLAKHICAESKDHGILASTIAAFLVSPPPRSMISSRGSGSVPPRSLLIIGDNGMGSWEILERAVARFHPGAVMASCGPRVVLEPHPWRHNNSRSQELGAFRAGLLALHPDATLCLKGLELLPASQHQALLEYLSIGMVSNRYDVTSSGTTDLLPGPDCIMATTTPISGRYDTSKSLCQNVSLPVGLVERFDLVALLQDRPEDPATRAMRACIRQRDGRGRPSTQRSALASAVGSTQTCTIGNWSSFYSPRTQAMAPTPGQAVTQWHLGTLKAPDTDSQVSVVAPTSGGRLSDSELRRFCEWVRSGRAPQPIWTDESNKAMAETFGQLRAEVARSDDLAPVTSRHLEVLRWLTFTVCRAGACQTVHQSHIETAADMLFSSLCVHTIRGTAGVFDASGGTESATGRPGKRVGFQARRQRFMTALHHQCLVEGSLTQTVDGMKELARKSRTFNPDFDSFLERLNEHGDLLKKGPGLYAYNGPV